MLKKQLSITALLLILMPSLQAKVVEIHSKNFETHVTNNNKPVILDVFATWCGPCQRMAPIFEELSQDPELQDKVVFAKMDTDKNKSKSQELGVDLYPTFLMHHKGKVIKKIKGSKKKDDLKKIIKDVLQDIESVL